jgi:predicted MFS family arabinose efflux permease
VHSSKKESQPLQERKNVQRLTILFGRDHPRSMSETGPGKAILTRPLVFLMAIASGATVANLYYAQPLLEELSRYFHVSQSGIGVAAMLIQVGYALGLLFLVPLGDIRERRSLIITVLLCSTAALLLISFSTTIGLFLFSSLLLGTASIVPQLLVPFAAQLALPHERGKAIGNVMSGLLVGILLSRTLSGTVGSVLGWQAVYRLAAVMIALLTISFSFILPRSHAGSAMPYGRLMLSLGRLFRSEPVLRQSALIGAAMFAAFSSFWTTLSFLLKSPVYNLGAQAAGLFGLVGVAGALTASITGRITDRVSPRFTLSIAIALAGAAYVVFWVAGYTMAGLVVGVIVLDIGAQSGHISNQARIYALDPAARNRINAVYMVTSFAGGAIGSVLSSYGWGLYGWHGVCSVGLVFLAIAGIIHGIGIRRE